MAGMEKVPRDFKGVWIPKEIWLSDQLSLIEKVLFVEIHSLDNERGCYASNRHFAEFFGISERQIRTYIASLKAKGFITVTIKNRNERVMRAAGKYARIRDEDIRRFNQDRQALIHRMSVRPSTR
jgi:DNA-binding transcriptional regulator PaaX